MQDVKEMSYMRRASVVTPAAVGVPAAVSGAQSTTIPYAGAVPSGTGVVQVADMFDPQLSAAGGVPKYVRIVPFGKGQSTTWTGVLYGFALIGTVWRPIKLFKFSAVCDIAITGDADTNLTNSDTMASAITPDGTYPAGAAETTPGDAAGPAHATVATKGCPFLLVTSSDPTHSRLAISPV